MRALFLALLLILATAAYADDGFTQGLALEASGDAAGAEQALAGYVAAQKGSAAAWYHLGRVREAQGHDSDAAEAYRNAIVAAVKVATPIMGAAGPATQDNIARLRMDAEDAPTRLQLACVLENAGDAGEARDLYRTVFESLHVDVSNPAPVTVSMELPAVMTEKQSATPANTLYVYATDAKKVGKAWSGLRQGPALASAPEGGWTLLTSPALDRQKPEVITPLGRELSAALSTDVLYLQVSADGRAWYWYWRSGHLLDQYCSNPGRPGIVEYRLVRQWAGRPDVLVSACHGKPQSSLSGGKVTITDLNALLYFYYPEMRVARPAAWRTPGTFMKVLVQFLGASDPPSRFSAHPAGFKPLPGG